MGKTQDIVNLLDKEYIPFSGKIPGGFYEKRKCRNPEKAEWFFRPRREGQGMSKGVCLGCKRRCSVVDPEGWPELAERRKPSRPGAVAFTVVERISVDELLRLKRVLRVDEAAWVLNVSRQKVLHWTEEGLLEQVPGSPVRVTCRSVERILLPAQSGDRRLGW